MSVESIITENLDIWTSAIKTKSASGRGSSNKLELYGIKKLRELIVDLALRGKLVEAHLTNESAEDLLASITAELKAKSGLNKLQRMTRDASVTAPESMHYSIPRDWIWCELQDVCLFLNGKAHEQYVVSDSEFVLINSKFVSNSGTEKVHKYVSEKLSPLSKGDLAIVMSDVPNGRALARCYLVEKDDIYTLNQRVGGLISTSGMNQDYFHLVMDRNKYLLSYDDGKKQSNLKKIHILSTPFPLPPKDMQRRIVAKVGELMRLCDQLESQTEASIEAHQILVKSLLETLTNAKDADELNESWQRISEHFDVLFTTEDSIDQLKQTILQLAVMGKLVKQDPNDEPASKLLERIAAEKEQLIKNKIYNKSSSRRKAELCTALPANWVHVQVGDICPSIVPNRDKPKSYTGNIPWVTLPAFPKDSFYLDDKNVELKLTKEELVEYSARLIPPNSVLMSCVGRFGLTAINKIEVSSNQQVHAFVVLSGLLPEYLSIVIQVAGKKLEKIATSTTIAYLNKTKCESIDFGLPPSSEQKRIIDKVNELLILCDGLVQQIESLSCKKMQLSETIFRH